MKRILFLIATVISTYSASAAIMAQIAHTTTIETLRLQAIEQELGIRRTDWLYELQDNESLEVIWYSVDSDEDRIIGQWTFDKKTNPSCILSLIFIDPPEVTDELTTSKITFGPETGSIQTSYTATSKPNISSSKLSFGNLEKIKQGDNPLKLWSLETNVGSGLQLTMYATVQLKKISPTSE